MTAPVRVNESLRQELLALAEQDQSFLATPKHDWNTEEVQRQLLELMGRLRSWLVEILDTYGWPGVGLPPLEQDIRRIEAFYRRVG